MQFKEKIFFTRFFLLCVRVITELHRVSAAELN